MFTYVYICNNLCLTYEIYFNLLNFLFEFSHNCTKKHVFENNISKNYILFKKMKLIFT